jgi:hypothetical protein
MVVGCSQILAALPRLLPLRLHRLHRPATSTRPPLGPGIPLCPWGQDRPEQPVVTAYPAATLDGRLAAGVRVTGPRPS